jgi:hypothetical protein
MNWTDPGDQDRGRVKRRGIPSHKNIDQTDLLSGTTPPPASSGPATRAGDPATSRAAARRASQDMTRKQLGVLTIFQMFGAMTDEQLVDKYEEHLRALGKRPEFADLLPTQTPSGIRSRRAELVKLQYLVPTGEKRIMRTGGEGAVHRLKNASESYGLDEARRIMRTR